MAPDQSHARTTAVVAVTTLAALGAVMARRRTTPARAIRRAFAAWVHGTGSIYDLMDDDAEIVIPGTTEHSGTYRKDAFLAEVAGPFVARFSAPPLPSLVALWSDRLTVVAQAEASGTTRDGAGYANAYVFIFEFAGKRVARVTEFLDMAAFEAVWESCGAGAPWRVNVRCGAGSSTGMAAMHLALMRLSCPHRERASSS